MKKINHLVSAADFKLLFGRGRRFEFLFFCIITRSNSLSFDRFAFVVPKTTEKKAHRRNRLRRRVSEWMRRSILPAHQSKDFVILFKKGAGGVPRQELYEELEKNILWAIKN